MVGERRRFANLSGAKILVTGACGFIGSRLHNFLCETDTELHAVARVPQAPKGKRSQWWYGDLGDIRTVRKIISAIKPDIIFHLAGRATGQRGLDLVLPTLHSNLLTTINVLTVAAEIGCRKIILPASLEEPDVDRETTVPSSPYAAAKWASTIYARMFHELYQMPVVITRIFLAYGPGPERPNKLVPYVIRTLLQGNPPQLTSGQRLLDWIYIDDVVEGLLAAAEAASIEGCTIELGSGSLVSVREVVEKIAKLMGVKLAFSFGALADRSLEQLRVANIVQAREKLGWTPTTSLQDGLERTVEWYSANEKMRTPHATL